jgi:hypothetical protein
MAAKMSPLVADPDFLLLELDRVIHSAQVRLEQQQIHVQELSHRNSERSSAQRRLKLMQAALKKLLDYKAQWHSSRGPGNDETQ